MRNGILPAWEKLPLYLQKPEIRPYYDVLAKHRLDLVLKRCFDVFVSGFLLVFILPVMGVIALLIKLDSPGPVFYRQERVTTLGKKFYIHKFRTMVVNADKIGTLVTVDKDPRVTRTGAFLRKYRLDELPQALDIFVGDMSFVGTRPEATKYVRMYTPEMRATLLLPAGVTSEASIRYKDEAELLSNAEDADQVYIEQVLPAKMKYNLESIRKFNLLTELLTMVRTVLALMGKEYN